MDISITYRHGWALLEDLNTHRTALCIPRYVEGPPQSLNFEIVGWHESYEDAMYVVSVMQAKELTIDDYLAANTPQPEPEPEPEPQVIEPKRKRRRPASLLMLW